MVGSYFIKNLSEEHTVMGLYNTHPILLPGKQVQVDITNKNAVLRLAAWQPEVIIHCAAITNILFCEKNEGIAYRVNVEGTQNIAELAQKSGSVLLYLSTDAVFNGEKGDYHEDDEPAPDTAYGKTKRAGEKISLNYDKSIIIRTSVFGDDQGKKEHNFITAILKVLAQGEKYSAFTDAIFCPIYTGNLLEEILKLINGNERGIFHIVGHPVTKYKFAQTAATVFNYDTNLILAASVKALSKEVKYPANLSLINTKIKGLFKDSGPALKDMLIKFKKDLGDSLYYGGIKPTGEISQSGEESCRKG